MQSRENAGETHTAQIRENGVSFAANQDLFREKVVAARRQTGRLQKELAAALGINPQVLSRKLHGVKQTFLTHAEVKQIIKTLALWDGITSKDEALQLLALMGLKEESFSEEEWRSAPLNRLQATTQSDTVEKSAIVPFAGGSPLLPISATSFLGREQQVQMLLERLGLPALRLLTLLGTGGVGKTRLALEVAHKAETDFADGVCFVSLVALREAALVPSTIAQALHIVMPVPGGELNGHDISAEEEVLKGVLRHKKMLLILDNVEQIPAIVPFIGELLSATSHLKILVTSRTVLHLYGEHEFDVPPLEVCTLDQVMDLETVARFSAIRLFVERAQAIDPAFCLTQQNVAAIVEICARLDGLPLAIELAAARTKVLPISLIRQRLIGGMGQSLAFLHSKARNILQRHQTLQATLDWSYTLLPPQQQRLFSRLSVFCGGWTVQAAHAICLTDEPEITLDEVLERIEVLIDHSLVKRVMQETQAEESWQADFFAEHAALRFYYLETIREYGSEQLRVSGEREAIQRRHASYYLTMIEALEGYLTGPQQTPVLSLLAREQDNFRAALTWVFEQHEVETAQRLCGALGKFWEARTQFREAHRWIDAALLLQQETPAAVRAKLLMAASRLALWEIDCERARELSWKALQLYEALDDPAGKTWALFRIGDSWHMQGEYARATSYLEECLPLFRTQQDWGGYAFTLSRLGAIAILQNNFIQAWEWLNEALPLMREYSEPGLLTITVVYLGVLALAQGNLRDSIRYLREGLTLAQQTDNHYMLASDLIVFGCLLGTMCGPSYAAHICSGAEALFESLNTALPEGYRPLYDAYLGSIKLQVDQAQWEAWWAEGKTLSWEALSAMAREASASIAVEDVEP